MRTLSKTLQIRPEAGGSEALVRRSLYLVAIFALMALMAPQAVAGKHPVPLEKDTDSATCISCHEGKAKGKTVHAAVASGCNTCHEVRVHKEITRVKLTTTNVAALCLQCHTDKSPAEAKGPVHQPAVRDCATCHDPHTSEHKYLLTKATEGAGKDDNLCLSCHTTGMNVGAKGSRHAALDMGCNTCHVTHKTGDPGQREFRAHLSQGSPALCLECHDVKEAALVEKHQKQPFAGADCLTCHDPHASNRPKLAQKFVHQPFGDASCDTCHEPAKEGKVVLTNADSKALCATCHSEQAEKVEKAKVPHAGAQGDCIACHDPHAGRTPGFAKPDPVNACLSCHTDQAEQHKKKYPHQPAFEQGCATCHEPHGGENPKLLRAKAMNALCLECHGPDAAPKKVEGQELVSIFDGKVRLPENYFNKVVRLPLKYGLGHPVQRHPVQDQMDPNDVTKVRLAINCGTCHQPHASAQPNLLVKDQTNNPAFCATCHKNLGG